MNPKFLLWVIRQVLGGESLLASELGPRLLSYLIWEDCQGVEDQENGGCVDSGIQVWILGSRFGKIVPPSISP